MLIVPEFQVGKDADEKHASRGGGRKKQVFLPTEEMRQVGSGNFIHGVS